MEFVGYAEFAPTVRLVERVGVLGAVWVVWGCADRWRRRSRIVRRISRVRMVCLRRRRRRRRMDFTP